VLLYFLLIDDSTKRGKDTMPRLRVKEIATAQGLTISQLHLKVIRVAPGSSVAYTTISNMWNNRTRRPDLVVLAAIARALGVDVSDLIEDDLITEEKRTPGLVTASAV
jgi:transcriptional regulator with XRE-family HTH domain